MVFGTLGLDLTLEPLDEAIQFDIVTQRPDEEEEDLHSAQVDE